MWPFHLEWLADNLSKNKQFSYQYALIIMHVRIYKYIHT